MICTQELLVDCKRINFLVSVQNKLLKRKKMKKFEKPLNERKKFAPKQKPYDKEFCAIANELLHIMVVTWAKPENTQITTTIIVMFLFLLLANAIGSKLLDLNVNWAEPSDIPSGEVGGCICEGDAGIWWLLTGFESGVRVITFLFLFTCFLSKTTRLMFSTISTMNATTSLMKKSTLLTTSPIELWPNSLRPM